MRHHLRRWQPQLRSLFVMRIESFKYRLRVSGYELPEVGRTAQHAYDDRFAAVLGALPHTLSAAFLGGAQSLHTNSRDEALGLPAEESARIALRTQRIIAYETRVTNITDSVGGSEYIENLTDEIEDGVKRILDEIEKTGGALSAIETRWVQQQIQNAAYEHQRAVESGTQVVVDRLEGKSPPGWEMPQLCRAGSLRTEGEQQAHLDAFIVLFRDIDDLITSLVEQIAATDVF